MPLVLVEDIETAKSELLNILGNRVVRCAIIEFKQSLRISLPLDHSLEDYEQFLSRLDFEYDSGFGGQELFGIVWLENNEWLTRGEYDGSEWWELHSYPEIFPELNNHHVSK